MHSNKKRIIFFVGVTLTIAIFILCFWMITLTRHEDNFNPVCFKEGELSEYVNYVYDITQKEYNTYIEMSEYFIANDYHSISDYNAINFYMNKLQSYYDATMILDFYYNDEFQGWLFVHYIKTADSYLTQGERETARIGVCYLSDKNLYSSWCSNNSICNFDELIPITENIYVFCIIDYDLYNNKFYNDRLSSQVQQNQS